MLSPLTKKKIDKHIDDVLNDIRSSSITKVKQNVDLKLIFSEVVRHTISLTDIEGQRLLADIFYELEDETLQESAFQSLDAKAKYYDAHLYELVMQHFSFKAPDRIKDIKESTKVNKILAAGAVGGVVLLLGVYMDKNNLFLLWGVALTLAGVIYTYLNSLEKSRKSEAESAINEYFDNVKKAFLEWIDEIETFYDAEIMKIKGAL